MADPFNYGVTYLSGRLGLTPEQARGAVRWMYNVESGLNPTAINPTSGAYGIGQWLGPRKQNLFQNYGSTPSIEQQFAHTVDELRGPESRALAALRGARTEDEAFRVWGKAFERPSPAEYAKATGGYSSGLRSEGYNDGASYTTMQPEKPETPFPFDAALDGLLGGKPIGEAEGGADHPLSMLDNLLEPRPKESGEAKLEQPDSQLIELLAPEPQRSTAAPTDLPSTEIKSLPEVAPPAAPPTIEPSPSDPNQLLSQLLGEPAKAPATQAPSQPVPAASAAPQPGPSAPSALLDALLGSIKAGGGQVLPEVARGARRGAEAGITGQRIEPAMTSPAEIAGAVPGAIAGGALSPLRVGGEALHATMTGQPVAAQEMLTAGMAGMDPVLRLPGGVPGEVPAIHSAVRDVLASEQGATRVPGAGGGGRPPPSEGQPSRRFPMLDPPVPGEGMRQIATRVDDALHRVLTNNTADKIELNHWLDRLPAQYKDPKVRAMMAGDIERRMIDQNAELNPLTQAFLDGPGKRLVENENRIANDLRRMLGKDAEYADLPSAPEGYVHRIVDKPGVRREEIGALDPERGRVSDVITGAMRGRSLSKFASGMQHRAPRFVLEDETGRRVFNKSETLDQKGYEYGQKIEAGGHEWTVKQPTMAEMEANTPVRYVHDYVGNLASNVLRLRRIKRHVELLQDLKSELEPAGLFKAEGAKGQPPEGFVRVELPQMRGYADPKIAKVLNNFWNPADDLSKVLNNVNRFLIGTLFVTPVPHIHNVGVHWMSARGWDWLSIPDYVRGATAGARALNAVWNLTPEYTRMLREGSGLLYGDVAMENFYNKLIQNTWREQMRNPEVWTAYAKSFGLKGVADLIKAEYRWSRKTLWAANDMLMLQRQFELEMRGMPTRHAIFEAERDIPNYRIPSEVLGSSALSDAMKSPSLFNFGRYHYGLVRALGEMIKDMIGPKATLAERTEAVGKLTVLGVLGALGYPALDAALKQATGNEDATVKRGGPLGLVSAGGYLARNAYQKFTGESTDLRNPFGQELLPGDKEWASIVAPLLTPAPTMTMIPEIAWGRDWMGREVIDPRASPTGMAYQAGEAAARHISPLGMGMQAMEEGGGAQAAGGLVSLNIPRKPPELRGKTRQMLQKRARRREQRDPVKNFIEEKIDSLRSPAAGP